MIFHRLGLINKNQRGFTLVELIIAVAIIGLITGATTTTIFQVFSGNARTSNHMTAVKQVQNAGYWVSHDTQMAQSVDTDNLTPPEILKLTWTEYVSDDEYQVVYSVVNNELQREHYTNRVINPDPDATTIVAQYVDSISCQFASGKLTLTVTATVVGWKSASETRTYEVMRRPGS